MTSEVVCGGLGERNALKFTFVLELLRPPLFRKGGDWVGREESGQDSLSVFSRHPSPTSPHSWLSLPLFLSTPPPPKCSDPPLLKILGHPVLSRHLKIFHPSSLCPCFLPRSTQVSKLLLVLLQDLAQPTIFAFVNNLLYGLFLPN